MQSRAATSESADNGFRNGMRNGKNATNTLVAGASTEFRNLIADVEDFITSTTSLTGEELERAKKKLSDQLATAKESMGDLSDNLIYKARKTVAVTNDYVHEQPWAAIGIGAAIGLLVGFVSARRI